MFIKRFHIILILLALSVLSSCVGTVQESKIDVNSLSEEDKVVINFIGLEKARAVSHDKVELEFTPIGSDDPNLKYLLYINGSQNPVEVSAVALNDSLAGRKIYTVQGLTINTQYKFRMGLENSKTKAKSVKEKEMVVKTFDNKTADFKGITSIQKVVGMSDTSIKVEWVPAKMDGVVVIKEFDPIYYEVTIIGEGGAANLNNPNYLGIDRQVRKVPDPLSSQITPLNHLNHTFTTFDGLTPGTTYYVQVRAVNKLWYTFSINPLIPVIPVDREVNTLFLKTKTDSPTGNFDFNQDSLLVSNALAMDAFTKVNTFWNAGEGTFTGYKIFLRKFPVSATTQDLVLADDKLTIEQMQDILDGVIAPSDVNGRFVSVASNLTSQQIGSLQTYEWYQFKIIQCRTAACKVYPLSDPEVGIVSELRAIRIQPSLAPFDGISRIDNPINPAGLDEIKVSFDPPSLAVGYADKLEVYCVDPDSVGTVPSAYDFDPRPLTTIPTTGSPVSKCNGIYLKSDPLLNDKTMIVKGVKTIPSYPAADATYCFAIFPAIRYQAEQIPAVGTFPVTDWVVRCVTPEVKTPTVAQFGGFKGTCNPVQDTIGVNWIAPTGGIYADYRIFYRSISGSETFKFSDAIAGHPAYTSIPVADGVTSKTITGLRPGTRYRVGILTGIDTTPSTTLYSEFNTTIQDCVTPMPVATFDEWTRIFSIGPKIDGRFPHASAPGNLRAVDIKAKILEALNVDGIPYEVGTDAVGTIDPLTFRTPIGHYHASYSPTSFTDDFDGAFGAYQGVSVTASQNGIVSLGWRDMNLDFLGNEFKECQRHPTDPAVTTNTACTTVPIKKNRQYGYKVFRSVDNRLSWEDVTGQNGTTGISLVYARDFNYYKRSNLAATTERMAFFTDYSVQAIYTDPEGRERGRILWYKVVPYFEKKPLSVTGGGVTSPNIIKVLLPPPNMALVKREMANKNACMAIGRDADLDKTSKGHYSCPFNGLGARPKGTPWNVANQVIDLGGDLLIDRNELGCQYTRGDYSSIPESGLSYFRRPSIVSNGYQSDLRDFKGYPTDPLGNEGTSKLQGCTAGSSDRSSLDSDDGLAADQPMTPNYKSVIYGDCLGNGTMSIAGGVCGDVLKAHRANYKFPGAWSPMLPGFDCTDNSDPLEPQHAGGMLNAEFRRNFMTQSEFAAVFYHRNTSYSYDLSPTGPGGANVVLSSGNNEFTQQCFINLAAIGGDGTVRARWFPSEALNSIKNGAGTQNILTKGIGEIYSDSNLFDAGEYKLPPLDLRTSRRFDDTTTLAKIATSNSAKLPPMTGFSQETAQQLCSAYDIEIGVSTNGTNFLATTFPMPKRLLRKVEILNAASWPKAGINHAESLNYTQGNITLLEGANQAGSCISSIKNVRNFGGLDRNSTLTPGSINDANLGKAHTGSSQVDESSMALTNSGKCISDFGIQDLIGNVAELSPERFFCDYSKDKLWFGKYDGGTPVAQTGIGDETNSIQIPDSQGYERLFWKETTIYFERTPAQGGGFREVGTRATGAGAVVTENVTWPQPNPDSGYCSIVDNVEAFAQQLGRFRDAIDNLYPVTITGGALNTAMIPPQNENLVDRESVNFLRNGDGAFLNFGASNIAPQFKDGNSLSITDDGIAATQAMALGPFFNPWIGLPMACKGITCAESTDNTLISTPFLAPKVGASVLAINNYPIGNSQIFNIGISDVIHSGGAAYTTLDLTLEPLDNNTTVIDQIIVYQNGSTTMRTTDLQAWWQANPSERGLQSFSGLRFALARGTPLIFANGGSYNMLKTGKYTSSVVNGYQNNTRNVTGLGIRCGVMIDSD